MAELYSLAVHDYAYANELVRQAQGHPDLLEAAGGRVDQARLNCDAARQALMKHREEHAC